MNFLAKWGLLAGVICIPLLTCKLSAADAAGLATLFAPEVSVSCFAAAAEENGQVWLRWTTESAMGSGAYRVLRQRPEGSLEPVGTGYLRLRSGEEACAYEWPDPAAHEGEPVRYVLMFLPRGGGEQQAAQWEGVIARERAAPSPASAAVAATSLEAPVPLTLPQAWIGNGPRVRTWSDGEPADRVRLSLREAGVYRVTALELAEAGGWDAAEVATAIATTNLSMNCQGEPVAWMADDGALLFYGVPAVSLFAPENVYWVEPGRGTNLARQVMVAQTPATTNAWFADVITRQGTNHLTRVSYNSRTDLPFVAFGFLANGDSLTLKETLVDCAPGVWSGTVTANLLSYYEVGTDAHQVELSLGGTTVGTASWSGERSISSTYPFSSTNLANGVAYLRLANVAPDPPWDVTDYTRLLWMSYGISYPRRYRARNEALRCTGGAGNTVSISGFSTNDVMVLDVTTTRASVVVDPVKLTCDGAVGRWEAAFPCGGDGRVYQAFSRSGGIKHPAVRGVRDVDWSLSANSAEHAILIPPEGWCRGFREAVQPLADYRNAKGIRTTVVNVEALYDAFSHGLVDPLAIRTFCATVHSNGLKYLLLAGAGAVDFKHLRLSVNDYTACLIPSLIAGQRFASGEDMTVAIDGALGDVDGDGVPDVAVGRMPTTRTQEVAVAVQKTITYENGLRWRRQALVTADWDCTGISGKEYPFRAGTDRLVVPLSSGGRTVKTYYTSDVNGSLESVRVDHLLPDLVVGAGLFHFFGHANELRLGYRSANQSLLRNTDISVSNWQKPTIAVLICCLPNRWHSPYTSTPNGFLPYGLFAAGTGFVAGLGSTGYMLGKEGEDLAVSLYSGGGVPGTRRLGDIWLRGMRHMAGSTPSERLLCYSLIGDPALVFACTPPNPGTVILIP